MKIQIIDDVAHFEQLHEQWNNLYKTIEDVTPFQSWEWNFLYWKYFCGNKKLQLLVFKEEEKLVGIFPFCTREYQNLQVMEPIGTRGTDYIHLLVDSNYADKILESFVMWFKSNDYSILNLEDIPCTASYLNKLISVLTLNNFKCDFNDRYCPCYEIKLLETWSDYLQKLSTRRKGDLLYYRRYALKRFQKMQLLKATPELIEKHFELHQKSRLIKKDKGTYANLSVKNFMKEFASQMHNYGALDLVFLLFDNKMVASILGVVANNIKYDITIGYDTSYAKLRPGTLLYSYDIEECTRRGFKSYDLSRGADNYKNALGAFEKYNTRLVISKNEKTIKNYLDKQRTSWLGKDYSPTDW